MNKKYCNTCIYKGEYDGTPICKKGATLTDAINYVKEPYCPFSVKEDETPTLEENKKLKKAIEILNRIYGFKLQDIKFSGFYELLIPDMTSDELTKEEYELLKEVLENAKN